MIMIMISLWYLSRVGSGFTTTLTSVKQLEMMNELIY